MNPCRRFLTLSFTPAEIEARRQYIYDQVVSNPNRVAEMTDSDLENLFWLYDDVFLQGEIARYFLGLQEVPTTLEVKFGNFGNAGDFENLGTHGERIETTGISGHCQISIGPDYCRHTLLISKPILSRIFTQKRGERNFAETTNGLRCYDQLGCLMITLEHEIIHLIINIWCRKSDDAHGPHFMTLSHNIFGHTEFSHSLGRGLSEDSRTHIERLRRYLRPGLEVRVYDPWETRVERYIVKDPNYSDRQLILYNPRDGHLYPRSLLDVLLPDEFI